MTSLLQDKKKMTVNQMHTEITVTLNTILTTVQQAKEEEEKIQKSQKISDPFMEELEQGKFADLLFLPPAGGDERGGRSSRSSGYHSTSLEHGDDYFAGNIAFKTLVLFNLFL